MNRYRGIELKLSGGKLHDGVGLICSRKQGKGGKRWMNMLFSGEALNLHSNKANPLREREIHWAPGSPQCYRDVFKHHLSLTLLNSIVILHFEGFFFWIPHVGHALRHWSDSDFTPVGLFYLATCRLFYLVWASPPERSGSRTASQPQDECTCRHVAHPLDPHSFER